MHLIVVAINPAGTQKHRKGGTTPPFHKKKAQIKHKNSHQSDLEVGDAPSDGAQATLRQIRVFKNYFKKIYAEEIAYNIGFVQEHSPDVWWYDGKPIGQPIHYIPRTTTKNRDQHVSHSKTGKKYDRQGVYPAVGKRMASDYRSFYVEQTPLLFLLHFRGRQFREHCQGRGHGLH